MIRSVHHRRRISPIGSRYRRLVLPRRRLVEDRQKFVRLDRRRLQVDDGVGAVTVVRVEDQVAVEVSGVQSGQRKSVAVSGQRSFCRGHRGSGCGREQVVKQAVRFVSRDAAALKSRTKI